jgi:hypothetical protein
MGSPQVLAECSSQSVVFGDAPIVPRASASERSAMTIHVRFQPVTAATQQAHEPVQLVWANQHLAALLVPAEVGWFLQIGFGRCEGEGIVFANLAAAEDWVRRRMQDCAAAATA